MIQKKFNNVYFELIQRNSAELRHNSAEFGNDSAKFTTY